MTHLSIRDLQKISSETISSLEGPTPVKAGDRTIGLLIPLKVGDPAKMAAALKRTEQLARERDPEEDRRILAEFGDVDPVNWSVEEVRKFKEEELGRVSRRSAKRLAVRESARPFVARKRAKPKKTGR
jgi:hypothetical protein